MNGTAVAVDSPSRLDALQRELARLKQEAANWKHKYFAEVEEQQWERTFRKRKGLKATPKNVAILLRRKWKFPGTKADPNSKVNLDAAGRRLIAVQVIADELDISDSTVRNAIDLLQAIGLLFDVVKHGHLKGKYDRVFFRWHEDLYQHPERIDTSLLPKKAGGDQFPPCPGCNTPMETRNIKYARCRNPNCEICMKGKELIYKAGKWRTPPVSKDAEQAKEAEPDNTKMVFDAEPDEQTKTSTYVYTQGATPVSEDANQNGTETIPAPPVAIPVPASVYRNPDLLPELKKKRLWAVGRATWNEKKQRWNKTPFIADLLGKRGASHSDPSTWRTFDETIAVYEKWLSWDNPFHFLMVACDGTSTLTDQDHCRNPETGEITPEAMERARRIHSYTEPSYGKEGLHHLSWGTVPAGRKNEKLGVEMYSQARFCALTGTPLPEFPQEMENRQEEVNALYKELFPPKPEPIFNLPEGDGVGATSEEFSRVLAEARRAKNAPKFNRLWSGDASDYPHSNGTPDYSRADQGLCEMFIYWCRRVLKKASKEMVDRLFRMSNLYREKWERADYRDSTIAQAFAFAGGGAA